MGIEVEVQELRQYGIKIYQGKMEAKDILNVTKVDECVEDQADKGYQRGRYPERCNEVAEYIAKSDTVFFPTSIVLSVRSDSEAELVEKDGRKYLKIPRDATLWIPDGQHRVGGFDRLDRLFKKDQYSEEEYNKGMRMELPVTFLYLADMDVDKAREIERTVFLLMNQTQARVPAALRTNLIHLIGTRNHFWHPLLDKEKYLIKSVAHVKGLNYDDESPLKGSIRMTAERGLSRPVSLNTMSRAIEQGLMRNDSFNNLEENSQYKYIREFWDVLADKFHKEVVEEPSENSILGSSAVTYAIMRIANDVYEKYKGDNGTPPGRPDIEDALKPLEGFDFSDSSPVAGFSGHGGVEIIYWNWLRAILEKARKIKEIPKEEIPEKVRKMRDKYEKMAEYAAGPKRNKDFDAQSEEI